jgi:KUP system potassium uptake protein
VNGTAVFLVPDPGTVPNALLHNLLHNQVLHGRIVFLTVRVLDVPHVPGDQRRRHEPMGHDMHRIELCFGFKDEVGVPAALSQAADCGLAFEPMQTSYFLGRETIVPDTGLGDGALAGAGLRRDGAQRRRRRPISSDCPRTG